MSNSTGVELGSSRIAVSRVDDYSCTVKGIAAAVKSECKIAFIVI